MKFSPSHASLTSTLPESFFDILPSCVSSLRLDFAEYKNRTKLLDFEELCTRLQEKCPHLGTLILTDCELLGSLNSVITSCARFLPNVKILAIHRSSFVGCHAKGEYVFTSKIEILDLSYSKVERFNRPPFSIMPHLNELCLYGTDVNNSWCQDNGSFLTGLNVLNLGGTWIGSRTFQAVQKHGVHLKELYICLVNLNDKDLKFDESAFPQLETICLRGDCVTRVGIVSLLKSCPSLKKVYVAEGVAESFSAHPFVVSNGCMSEIVKAIAWDHNHNVNYLDI